MLPSSVSFNDKLVSSLHFPCTTDQKSCVRAGKFLFLFFTLNLLKFKFGYPIYA